VFVDVAEAFDTFWLKGLLYKLTIVDFPFYLVKSILISSLADMLNVFPIRHIYSYSMRSGVDKGGHVSSALFSLCVYNMPTPSHHVELALNADDTTLVARLANRRCSSVGSRLILAWLNTGYGTGGLLSTSQVVPLRSLLRLPQACKGPDKSTFSESQCSGSKPHGILGWPLIRSWPVLHPSWKKGSSKPEGVLKPLL
jgi:hypothetical protein